MRIFYSSIICLITILLFSCADIQFPDFYVSNCNFTSEGVLINFSNTPNEYLLKKAFTMTEDDNNVKGTLIFLGNSVIYYPENGIRDNYIYEISISTSAEDINGKSLETEYKTVYTNRPEFVRPTVVSITPESETVQLNNVENIIIEFSEPVDEKSFEDAFSLSPSCEYLKVWDNEKKQVTISPTHTLQNSTRYEIKISKELKDKYRNNMLHDFTATFVNNDDHIKPTFNINYSHNQSVYQLSDTNLNSLVPDNVEFKIDFSEKMTIDYISSYIKIEPTLNLSVIPNNNLKNTATVKITSGIEWGNEYTLKVLKGLKDLSGNQIDNDYSYKIKFNNESFRPVTVNKVLLDLKNSTTEYATITNFCTQTFAVEEFPTTNTPVSTDLYFFFNISENALSIVDFSLMDNLSIEFTNSCFESVIIKSIAILTETDIAANQIIANEYSSLSNLNGKLCVAKVNLEFTNSSSANCGILSILLENKVKDSLGNFLKQNYSWSINKQ